MRVLVFIFFATVSTSLQAGLSPLANAVKGGNIFAVKSILRSGVDSNVKDRLYFMPLLLAVLDGRLDIVNLLIDHGADVNMTSGLWDWAPLHGAIVHDKTEIANVLIRRGADVKKKNKFGQSPLDLAKNASGGRRLMREE
jgi:ankyrin repeat protein